MLKIKFKHIEILYLILIFGLLMYVSVGTLWDHKIEHDFPYGYLASDGFQHQVRAESIKNMGNYRNEAFYAVKGSTFAPVIGFYSSLSHHLAVLLSYNSGLETYDTIYFLVFLMPIISAFIMYLMIRKFSKNIALLAIPFSFLVFARNNFILITWGHWPAFFGHFFLICIFWAMLRFKLKASYVLLGLFMSASFLSHPSEFIFGVLFIGLYLVVDFIRIKKIDVSSVKKVIFAGVLFFILCFYYFIIWKSTWVANQGVSYYLNLFSITSYGNDPFVYLSFFKWLWVILGIGLIVGVFLLRKKKNVALLVGFFVLVISYGNYFGFERHALRTRALWGIYLSVFFGLGVYYVLKFLVKKWRKEYSIVLGVVFLLIFGGFLGQLSNIIPVRDTFTSPGIMNKYHWDAMVWISENTALDSKVYFFYGDTYEQDAQLRNVERAHFLAITDDLIASLQNKTIKRFYLTERPGDTGGIGSPYRKSFFKFGFATHETDEYITRQRDICEFDYYIFDKASSYYPALAQYNALIANKLMENDFIDAVYANDLVVVLRNNNPGGDCIVEQTFE